MKNEPKIRIKGFEGEWKETRLGDIGNTYSGVGFPIEEQGGCIGTPFYKVSDMNKKGNEAIMKSSNNYVNKNQIENHGWTICRQIPAIFFAKVGAAVLLDRKRLVLEPCLCDNNTMLYCLNKDSWVPFFCLSLFETIKLSSLSQIGTLPSYNGSAVENLYIKIPPLSEQRAIATYFRHLDSLIEIADKKVASLKQVKEASLQSMFPKEGQKVPEVRFKGFEGEWKVCQGEDLFETYNERNRPDLPVLSAFQDIRGMAVRSDSGYEISHNKRNEVTYKVVKPGQFVMHLRSFQGGFAHSSIEGITSPAYTVFGFKESNANNDYYWKTIFMSKEFIDRLKTITYGIRDGRSISFPEFLKMKFRVPSIDEQRKIASFFVHLDKQIAIAQQRLDLLRRIKSACLDGMFV